MLNYKALKAVLIFIIGILICVLTESQESDSRGGSGTDRLKIFYERIEKPDVKYCEDKTRLLPLCKECIPGLQQGAGSMTCNEFIPSSKAIRDEIKRLTDQRYGHNPVADRPFGLYPCKSTEVKHFPPVSFTFSSYITDSIQIYVLLIMCVDLEKPDFMSRQLTFGKMLSQKPVRTLIDIGAYYNPIHLFMAPNSCPSTVIVIEPILDPLSISVPCSGASSSEGKATYVHILPITFKFYMGVMDMLEQQAVPKPETVVCIGCDSHYGPNRHMLETAFPRPYALYIEYPSEYIHNTPFKKMNGQGMGEEMVYINKFQPKTNETQYTKRVMKVIEYK